MVISPKTNGVIYVILGEKDLFLPEKFNHEKVLAFRKDSSTGNELRTIKPLGELAKPEIMREAVEAKICTYNGDGNPLHQHADQKWWHFDAEWNLEHGPFDTYEEAYGVLEAYCQEVQTAKNFLTTVENFVKMVDDETLSKIVESNEGVESSGNPD